MLLHCYLDKITIAMLVILMIKTRWASILTTMVFCYQNCSVLLWEKNCSSDREKLLKFEAEGWEFAKFWDQLNNLFKQWKVRTISCNRMFFYCSLRFLRNGKLEQLQFKLEKNIGIWKSAGKLENSIFLIYFPILLL